jgi:hypothetical protein
MRIFLGGMRIAHRHLRGRAGARGPASPDARSLKPSAHSTLDERRASPDEGADPALAGREDKKTQIPPSIHSPVALPVHRGPRCSERVAPDGAFRAACNTAEPAGVRAASPGCRSSRAARRPARGAVSCITRTFARSTLLPAPAPPGRMQVGGSRTCGTSGGVVIVANSFGHPKQWPPCPAVRRSSVAVAGAERPGLRGGDGPASANKLSLAAGSCASGVHRDPLRAV